MDLTLRNCVVCFDKIGACDKLQALMKGRENGDGHYLKEQHKWEWGFKKHAGKDMATVMDVGLGV